MYTQLTQGKATCTQRSQVVSLVVTLPTIGQQFIALPADIKFKNQADYFLGLKQTVMLPSIQQVSLPETPISA